MTPLQAAWWPTKAALDQARRELDAETFAVFVQMVATVVARWEAERLEREWRAAA